MAVGCSGDNSNYAEPDVDGGDAGATSGGPSGSGTTAPSTSSVGTTGNASAASSGVTSTNGFGGGLGTASGVTTTTLGTTTFGSTTAPGGNGSVNTTAGTTGSAPNQPVDCAAIAAHDGWELCDSGSDFCSAVFTDGAGCAAVCASVGLSCAETWENAEDSCAPDTSRSQLSCSSDSGHESDYCLCQGPGGSSSTTTTTSTTGAGGTGGAPTSSSSSGGASGTTSDATVSTTTGGGTGGGGSTNPGCETVTGDAGTVNSTIVVASGETFDGQCRRYRAGSALGDGSQDEDQLPVFRLEDGARLINVVLGAPAADGVHTYGDVTLENIVWEDIGEDALTIKESGTVVLDGGGAFNGEDKVFQINAASTFRVSNFTARSAGKFIRQNGGTTFRVDVFIDRCDISDMDEAIFRTDSSSSTVTMTNTRYSNIGDSLFIGVSSGNITQSGNTEY